jgi:AcrR family transcriptional regulator
MATAVSRTNSTAARRQAVLEAALDAFAEHGFSAAGIEDVRRRSGASVGSIYHHFGGKDGLAAELYVGGLRSYQEGLLGALEQSDGARDGVEAAVRHHLGWIAEHPKLARFMFENSVATPELREQNRRFFGAVHDWLARHADSGEIRRLPRDVYYALLIGPSQELARHWLAGRVDLPLEDAAEELAHAAWMSLRNDQGGPS